MLKINGRVGYHLPVIDEPCRYDGGKRCYKRMMRYEMSPRHKRQKTSKMWKTNDQNDLQIMRQPRDIKSRLFIPLLLDELYSKLTREVKNRSLELVRVVINDCVVVLEAKVARSVRPVFGVPSSDQQDSGVFELSVLPFPLLDVIRRQHGVAVFLGTSDEIH